MGKNSEHRAKIIPVSAGQCIWVDAGVISYRLCPLSYECERCSLHQALTDGPWRVSATSFCARQSRPEAEERRAGLEALFRKLPASARKCRHMLTGDVSYKLCINAFKCATCSFAQMMEDAAPADRRALDEATEPVSGTRFRSEVHYHRSHTWVRVEHSGDVRVGLDDFGQRLLGDVERIALPKPGEAIFEGAPACDITLAAGHIGILAPLSGRVITVNQKLIEQPALLHESPFGEGWLFVAEPLDLSFELASLLYGEDARDWLVAEIRRAHDRLGVDASKAERRTHLVGEMVSEFLLTDWHKAA
jgi:glycine cleavage system H lipoate-binding protein